MLKGFDIPMTDPDLDSFPKATKGRRFEDFTPGQLITHHWGRTISAADNALFSTATCAWIPMYLNAEFARAHGHGDVVVNPMLVLCTVVGLSVEDLSEGGGPFLGVNECNFHLPVNPDDTITARSEVVDKRASDSRSDVGIVTWHTEAHNQHGQLVLDFFRTNLIAMRTAA